MYQEEEFKQTRSPQNSDFAHLLEVAAARFGVGREFRAIRICQEFRVVLPQIISNAEPSEVFPISFKAKTLTIAVTNSAWAQKITMHKEQLLQQINQRLGEELISKITVRMKEPKAGLHE
jgi:hypothetical protein